MSGPEKEAKEVIAGLEKCIPGDGDDDEYEDLDEAIMILNKASDEALRLIVSWGKNESGASDGNTPSIRFMTTADRSDYATDFIEAARKKFPELLDLIEPQFHVSA